MSRTSIEISELQHAHLVEIATHEGKDIAAVLANAIDKYRSHIVIEQLNEDYARLRQDPEAWAEVEAERAVWDTALLDGLEDA